MSHWPVNYFHQSASNSSTTVGGVGGDTRLVSIIIGTGASTSVVTVYDGATSAGSTVATIAAGTQGQYRFGGARMRSGYLTVVTSTAAADVTVTYV